MTRSLAGCLFLAATVAAVSAQAADVGGPGPSPSAIERAARAEQATRGQQPRSAPRGSTLSGNQQQQAAKAAAEAAAAKDEAAKQDLLKAANIRRDELKKQEAQRESRQPKFIDETIAKGSLTTEEITALETQLAALKKLDEQFKPSGFLTRDEAKQLAAALNEAAQQILADKHDTSAATQPAPLHLGTTVFLNADIAARLDSGSMLRSEAHQFLKDFARLITFKKTLATEELADADRTKQQRDYNTLLNQYFTLKQPTTQPATAIK